MPEKMSFPKWQAWRRKEGRRPVKSKDGRGLSTAEEVALWKAIMVEYHGEDESEEEEGEASSSELEAVGAALAVPGRAAAGRVTPGTGVGGASPRPSSAGTGAAGTDELLKQLNQVFRPDKEEMGLYLARVTRLVMALKTLGSRLKTYTNLYRAAWRSGEVLENPEAVYLRIKEKDLVFAESTSRG
eukprot:s2360_g6.t1